MNGASEEEIREVILQAAGYCGMPAGIEGFRVAGKVIADWKKDQEAKGNQVERHTEVGLEQRVSLEEK